jgi:urease accessory protein
LNIQHPTHSTSSGQAPLRGNTQHPIEEGERLSWLPWLLQTADALFPTGAYAHSLGFEESVRLGMVRDEASLAEFLRQQIVPALRQLELPYLRFAFDASCLEEWRALDHEIGAWKLAREARAASAQLGGRRLKALRAVSSARELTEFDNAIQSGRAAGHHLIVCGLQARVESIPLHAALTTYFYQSLAAICAAAMKLIRIGQDGCQRVLRGACIDAQNAIEASISVAREDAGCFNPLLEIAAMRHERADERLFIS